MNPAQWLVRTALLTPQAPALFKGAQLEADYAEFLHRVAALAGGLRAQYGISKGDRVAVFMSNCTEYLEALYAIWFIGAVAVPINAKLHAKEAAWIIAKVQAAQGLPVCGRAAQEQLRKNLENKTSDYIGKWRR